MDRQHNETEPEGARPPTLSRIDSGLGWSEVVLQSTNPGLTWTEEELPAIWQHQLQSTLQAEPGSMERGPSIQELLTMEQPDMRLLSVMKSYGKANCNHPESLIPEDIARGIYYLSILTARMKLDETISSLSTKELASASQWLAGCGWLDQQSRSIATQSLGRFTEPGSTQGK